jgi:RNA polymerase sigma factor (sigma-70 family)
MTALTAIRRLRRDPPIRSVAARGNFEGVYRRHHQALYRYCRSILRNEDDAQDALQSTMARALAALEREERDFEVRPWLFRIAHNEAISILRQRRDTGELDETAGDAGELEDRVAEREELRLLRLDLEDLPERQRAALVLRELSGFSHAEIGAVLDLSPGAVKQTIFEARSALFRCQEGREMDCEDVRRMLSDGDGRVLRGRGVRAHLRSCRGCRRFRADLERRPQALRMLAPPLPVGTAAAMLTQILGSGTAAKLLACIAIAGSSATVAAELQGTRAPARPAPEHRESARAPKEQATRGPVPVVRTAAPQPVERVSAPSRPVERPARPHRERARVKHGHRKAHKPKVAQTHAAPMQPRKAAQPAKPAKPAKPLRAAKPAKPQKPIKLRGPATSFKPKKVKQPKQAKPVPTVVAVTEPQRHVPPGQAKPEKGCRGHGAKSC